MSQANDSADLGPLPKTDRNAELQRLSFREFSAVLPTDRFVFRDERTEDAGVDASIELLTKSMGTRGYTNLRSQIQLKGTDCEDVNADGSISLQVKVSNLNYLLNGPSPLFILYVAPRNELRFEWARDERKRLDSLNPEWMQQERVTVHFRELLTPDTLDGIYDRILREGRLQRKIQDTLAGATLAEEVVIGIDPETLSMTGPEEAARLLLSTGLTLVSSGFAAYVLDQARLLRSDMARTPRLQLIQAYAQFTQARYQAALVHLQDTLLRREELTVSDKHFLVYLRDACEFQSGRIDLDEYSRRAAVRQEAGDSPFALAHRLDVIRRRFLQEIDMARRAELFDALRSIVSEVLSNECEQKGFKLQAKLTLLHAEGGQLAARFFNELFRIKIREGLSLPTDTKGRMEKLMEQWGEWERPLSDALLEAEDERHPSLISFALDSRAAVRVTLLSSIKLFISYSQITVPMPEVLLRETTEDIVRSMKIYLRAGHLEGELRTKMLLADLHLLADRESEARALAEEVLPKAEAMEYGALLERAQEHLSGRAILSRLEAQIKSRHSEDGDFRLATESDVGLREFARDMLEELNLPLERLPVVEREALSMRGIAHERLGWCRYIELIQNLRHTEHPSTHFLKDPDRYCVCEKYEYESALGYPDWNPSLPRSSRHTARAARAVTLK
jgi:hypothetical protein